MAYTKKGVSVLTIPDDVPKFEVEAGARITSSSFTLPELFPQEEDLKLAKLALNNAKKPVILAGKGAKHAKESLLAFAEHIGAPIVLTLPAKGIIPDEHPLCIGGLG